VCLKEVKTLAYGFAATNKPIWSAISVRLSQVADLVSFRHLLQLVALRNTKVLNISELARDAKLNVVTTSRFFL